MQQQNPQGSQQQMSQQYHQQKVNSLIQNFRTSTQVDDSQRQRIQAINNKGMEFAMALEQNSPPGYEQTNAIERALEARQWGEDAVRSRQNQ